MLELITTGGTIDKSYNPLNGELIFVGSYLPEIIKNARLNQEIKITHLLAKDSLEMGKNDREDILNYCLNTKNDKILISHGTDTMVKTAKILSAVKNKTIVLFGAMVPYFMQKSDASFNFGCALSSVKTLKNGVYVVMGGEVFEFDKVVKNTKLGIFESC